MGMYLAGARAVGVLCEGLWLLQLLIRFGVVEGFKLGGSPSY